jgi:hypothetical protein
MISLAVVPHPIICVIFVAHQHRSPGGWKKGNLQNHYEKAQTTFCVNIFSHQ